MRCCAFPYKTGELTITAAGTQAERAAGRPDESPLDQEPHRQPRRQQAVCGGRVEQQCRRKTASLPKQGRAAIWEIDIASGAHRIFASGLRNPVGMAWGPDQKTLWTVVNERDEIGSDLVPDYLTSVKDGGFYGWPWSYYGQHVDERVHATLDPTWWPRHSFPITRSARTRRRSGLPGRTAPDCRRVMRNGMFIGQHGSWNRKPRSGYKVIFVPFDGDQPAGAQPQDVLTGFLSESGNALGRPVGVAIDRSGALLVADDVGNVIWRVTAR